MTTHITNRKSVIYERSPILARYFVKGFVVFASGIFVGLVCGQRIADAKPRENTCSLQEEEPAADGHNDHLPKPSKPPPRAIKRPFLVRPTQLYTVKDEVAEQQYREQQANDIIDQMLFELKGTERSVFNSSPEAVANEIFLYQRGLLDGLARTAPDLIEDLAQRIGRTMCDSKAKDNQLISLARMIQIMPELADEKGLDCIFTNHNKEEIVLWSMLDAWNKTEIPKSAALSQIEQTATDERTRARFLDQENIGYQPVEVEMAEVQ
jgi:hypothetical protein